MKEKIQFFNSVTTETQDKIEYYKGTYDKNHWAYHLASPEKDDSAIAVLKVSGVCMTLILNPTDARGYRSIVRLATEKEEEMHTTFNRPYTPEEEDALAETLMLLARIYRTFGVIAQIAIAGNASQSLTQDGRIQLGNQKEPSLLHGHVIALGNSKNSYIANIPLRGPDAGTQFNMMGKGTDEGNTSKEPWHEGEITEVAYALAYRLNEYIQTKKPSHIEIVSIKSKPVELITTLK